MKRSKDRFLPDFSGIMPQHDTPAIVTIDTGTAAINLALARLHAMAGSKALGVGETVPAELEINGRRCSTDGDSLNDRLLFETADHHEGAYPKIFYLVPISEWEREKWGGAVPSVRCEDTEFDHNYAEPDRNSLMRLYVLSILTKLARKMAPRH